MKDTYLYALFAYLPLLLPILIVGGYSGDFLEYLVFSILLYVIIVTPVTIIAILHYIKEGTWF